MSVAQNVHHKFRKICTSLTAVQETYLSMVNIQTIHCQLFGIFQKLQVSLGRRH